MIMNVEKTNVVRLLEQKKVSYKGYCYLEENGETTTVGTEVAQKLGQDENQVFKTLVTVGKTNKNYVFVVPVAAELDLKKAAKAVGEKSIAMIKQKDLLPLTGYIHGGCSPIGMKKVFPTVVHETAKNFESIIFSAGKVGYQVEIAADDLGKFIRFDYADIIVKD